jgi:hypothetical protein
MEEVFNGILKKWDNKMWTHITWFKVVTRFSSEHGYKPLISKKYMKPGE